MKAATSLLAVLLMLSSTSLAQTAPVQETAPAQQAVPTQEAAPAQQAGAGGDASKPEAAKAEAESQASTAPTVSTPSTEAVAASADAVPAANFAPGAKVFLEPMEGFEKLLAESITKHKVPVVLVTEREKADFVMSGEAHLKTPNWIKGTLFATAHGKGNISIKDARTGNEVFAYKFTRVDTDKTDYQIYQAWANSCAGRLKKAMKKK